MTETEKQELSKAVAEKLGIDEYYGKSDTPAWHRPNPSTVLWLHDDSARCFDLMVDHDIELCILTDRAVAKVYPKRRVGQSFAEWYNSKIFCEEMVSNNLSKQEATRIAILRALLAKGEA